MAVATLTLEIHLPGCTTLKEKRSRLKPLLLALRREFNVAASEMGENDNHRVAIIGLVSLGNQAQFLEQALAAIPGWVESHRPDLEVMDHRIELI